MISVPQLRLFHQRPWRAAQGNGRQFSANDSQQMTQEWECLAYRLKRLREQGVAIAYAFGTNSANG